MFYATPCSRVRARANAIAQKLEEQANKSRAETKLAILRASVDVSKLKLKIKA